MSNTATPSKAPAAVNGQPAPSTETPPVATVATPQAAAGVAPSTDAPAQAGPSKEPVFIEVQTYPLDQVLVLNSLQSRQGGIDNARAGQIGWAYKQQAEALAKGEPPPGGKKIPPMKAFLIEDERHKHHNKMVLVGGFHRMEGRHIGEFKDGEFEVWRGTWADAVRAAAKENIEHDTAGRYRSNEDKRKSVLMFCGSYSNVAKVNWPDNRVVARECGVSHQFVNNMDPFGRGATVTAKDDGGIRDRSEETKKKKKAKSKKKIELFDWKNYDQKIGYMARGLDTVAESYGVDKNSPEFKQTYDHLEAVTKQFKIWHDKYSSTPPVAPKAAAKPKSASKPKAAAKAKGSKKKSKAEPHQGEFSGDTPEKQVVKENLEPATA